MSEQTIICAGTFLNPLLFSMTAVFLVIAVVALCAGVKFFHNDKEIDNFFKFIYYSSAIAFIINIGSTYPAYTLCSPDDYLISHINGNVGILGYIYQLIAVC